MKKTNIDLVVGASILIALFILVFGVLWLKESLVAKKMVSYTVLFPNVGTLQLGDPVMTNGVTKGRVKNIYLRDNYVAAVITLEKNITLTDSCVVRVQNIGLMGERGIGIELKKSGTPCRPSQKNDTTYLGGSFDTGIAEAMGMMGTVLSDVAVLLTDVSAIMRGTVGDTSFITLFRNLTRRLDTLTLVAENLVKKNGPLVDKSIANLSAASTQLRDLLDSNRSNIDAIMADGKTLASYSVNLMGRIDSLATSIQGIVQDVENGQGALGMLAKNQQFSHDLRQTIANVDTLVREVQRDALKLKVVDIKWFGSSKKKK
ncbi:MAG: MCE family protein [Chitinispirillaceae bacterium]|nr:MCE family protein [Chitinispirillaceae bacterium]